MEKHIFNYVRDTIDLRDYKFSKAVGQKVEVPSSIDLSPKMPKIFNQLTLGSCSSNSTARGLMFARNDTESVLSRLFQYYKTRELEGTIPEDSGASNRNAIKSTNKFGICKEELMPYEISKFTEAPTEEAVLEAMNHKSHSYYSCDSLDDVFQALAQGYPVVIGMEVFESFETKTVARTGKMVMPSMTETILGGHSVLIEGKFDNMKVSKLTFFRKIANFLFGTKMHVNKGYLKVANSWGEEWGDKGYFYMPYEYFEKYVFDCWCIV